MAENSLVFKEKNGEAIRYICAGLKSDAYFLTSQRVLHLTKKSDGVVVTQDFSPNNVDLITLCDTDDGLFGISSSRELYEYHDASWQRTGNLYTDSSTATTADDSLIVFKTAAVGKKVFVVIYDANIDQYQCWVINRETNSCNVLSDLSPLDCSNWKDNTLLFYAVSKDGSSYFCTFDTKENTIAQLTIDNMPNDVTAFTYEPSRETLYVATSLQIVKSQQQTPFTDVLSIKYANGLACIGMDMLAVWYEDSIYICDVTREQAAQSICVMDVSTRFDNDFTAETGISLQKYQNPNMDVIEHISYALSVRDSTVDIYGFLAHKGLQTVKEKEMYFDLGQSDILRQMSGELYDALSKILYYQNEIVAWPISVQPLVRVQNDELLLQNGFSVPETYDDLLDLLPQIVDSDLLVEKGMRLFDTLSYSRKSLLEYFMRQYIFYQQKNGEEVNFGTDLFRKITQRILTEIPKEDPSSESTGEEAPLFTLTSISPVIQEDMCAPFRLSTEATPAIETWVYVAVINPYSKNKEQALRYLEYFAQQKDEESYSYYANMRDPYESPRVQDEIAELTKDLDSEKTRAVQPAEMKEHEEAIRQLESRIALYEQDKYLITQEAIENYHRLAQMFIVSENSLIQYDDSLDSFIDQLIAGRYTLDGFIQACNQHVKMIYAENNAK